MLCKIADMANKSTVPIAKSSSSCCGLTDEAAVERVDGLDELKLVSYKLKMLTTIKFIIMVKLLKFVIEELTTKTAGCNFKLFGKEK